MSLHPKDFFHTGIIVDDLEASCRDLSRLHGVTWGPLLATEVPIWQRKTGKVAPLAVRAIFTIEYPHIEVLQAVPGTRTETVRGRPIDHLGYWSDDLIAESDALEKQGLPRTSCGIMDGKLFGHAYHEGRDGLLVELVDRTLLPDWNGWLRGEIDFTKDPALLRYLNE
jgi:hypothetical protein